MNLMNNARRKMTQKAIGMLEMREDADQVLDILESVLYDEEDAYDNTPENLQGSWRAMESEDAIDALNEAIDAITEIQNTDGAYENKEEDKIKEIIELLEGIN